MDVPQCYATWQKVFGYRWDSQTTLMVGDVQTEKGQTKLTQSWKNTVVFNFIVCCRICIFSS